MYGWLGPSHVGGSIKCEAIKNLIATALASEDTTCPGRVPLIAATIAFDVVVQVLRLVEQTTFLLLALVGLAHFLAILLTGSVRVLTIVSAWIAQDYVAAHIDYHRRRLVPWRER